MRGQARCHLHGGGTPQARRAAGRRVAIEAARREALRLGLTGVDLKEDMAGAALLPSAP